MNAFDCMVVSMRVGKGRLEIMIGEASQSPALPKKLLYLQGFPSFVMAEFVRLVGFRQQRLAPPCPSKHGSGLMCGNP